jgi:outer membrane autotransporter protein
MDERNDSDFRSMTDRPSKRSRPRNRRPEKATLFTVGLVACLCTTSLGQIENNVYIANSSSNNLSIINTATDTVSTLNLTPSFGPFGIAVTPDGRFAYITNGGFSLPGSNTISVLDVATNSLVKTITPAAVQFTPAGVAVTPDARFAYVASRVGGKVSVINTTSNTVTDTITGLGTGLEGVAITPNGKFAYVTRAAGTVTVINTATNSVEGNPIPVGAFPFGVAFTPNGAFAYVGNGEGNTVSVINTATKAVGTINLEPILGPTGEPLDVAVTPDGKFVYVVSATPVVAVIATATNKVVGSIDLPVGSVSAGISITPNGEFVFVEDFRSHNVSEIDVATNTLVKTFNVGINPLSLGLFIGPNIIVAPGGPLSVGSDAALTPLGFGTFVNFNGGTLQTTGSLVTARTISLLALGGTIDSNGFDSVFSGAIVNTGSLTKIGAGTLTLTGINTYTGGTTIDAGTLIVSSRQALGLGNVVVNGGILKSNSQPINVQGNYTQNAGGTLQLGLAGSALGQYDVLNVAGRATLGGTLQLFALNGYLPKNGDKLTLILAAGGVSGEFASLVNPFNSLVGLDLVYLPDSVVLEFMASDFARFALTPNERAVARALDKVLLDPREIGLISSLRSEPIGNLPGDFERISPDSLSALYEISFSAANVQASNLENRFAEIRSGSSGFSSSLSIANSPGALVEGSNGKAIIEPGKNVLTPSPENRWGVWVSGSGEFAAVNGDGNGKGYEFTTGGVTFGLDCRLTKNFAVGVALGYAHIWTNLAGDGDIDVNSGRGGLYATYSQDGFYLNGYAGGAYNSYDTRRDAFGGAASGSTESGEFDGYVGSGYEFHCGGFTVGPMASLEYSYVAVSGYTETGSLAPLNIVSQNQDSLRTNVGLSASYTCKAGKVRLRPSLQASWQHEFSYSALPVEAQFASGAGGNFTVNGPHEGHESALINAGIDVQWTPTLGTYFGYIGNVGRSNYDLNSFVCSVRWDF